MESFPVKELFSGERHAQVYSLYRPSPPKELIEEIFKYLQQHYDGGLDLAIDAGCGTGQCTILIAKEFKQVIGIDVSEAQIKEAVKSKSASNIEYKAQPAEILPVENSSTQLVTVATAIHYFELDKFFAEVQRVLVPGGVLAVFCYTFIKPLTKDDAKNKEIDALIEDLYLVDLKDYWSPKSMIAFQEYRSLEFPFHDVTRIDGIRDSFNGKLCDLMCHMETLSGYQRLLSLKGAEEAEKLSQKVHSRLCKILELKPGEDQSVELTFYRDFFLIMGCKK